jgi:ribosome-dependent ATPase
MTLMAVTIFGVPIKGSLLALTLGMLIYVTVSTGLGLLFSTFTRSQIAALFLTVIGTMIPTVQFAGLLNPVSSMEGSSRFIGQIYPATHMLIISRGVFNKSLGLADLAPSFWPMLIAVPVILGCAIALLKKQES